MRRTIEDYSTATTEELWMAIESNALQALRHTNWDELLERIRTLCGLISDRMRAFERRRMLEQGIQA